MTFTCPFAPKRFCWARRNLLFEEAILALFSANKAQARQTRLFVILVSVIVPILINNRLFKLTLFNYFVIDKYAWLCYIANGLVTVRLEPNMFVPSSSQFSCCSGITPIDQFIAFRPTWSGLLLQSVLYHRQNPCFYPIQYLSLVFCVCWQKDNQWHLLKGESSSCCSTTTTQTICMDLGENRTQSTADKLSAWLKQTSSIAATALKQLR